jgi:YidC/Oxa1 family membrane protein insertase
MTSPSGPGAGDTRNVIIAIVLSILVLFGFQYFVTGPQQQRERAERAAQAEKQAEAAARGEPLVRVPIAPERAIAATRDMRIPIVAPSVGGSLSREGVLFDDVTLHHYRRTIERNSPDVRILAPREARGAADADFGWEMSQNGVGVGVLDQDAVWTLAEGERLTPQTPVTLTLRTATGFEITRKISIDDRYMFTIEETVRNVGDAPREIRPYGVVRRLGMADDFVRNGMVHQGMAGVFGPNHALNDINYRKAAEHARDKDRGRASADERIESQSGVGGWLGLSEHYWLTALAPDQSERIDAWFDSSNREGDTDYRSAYRGAWRTVAPGEAVTYTQRLFVGAKEVDTLQDYQRALNIPGFDSAVDWGFLGFLTRPFFMLLHFFGGLVGNFGVAILLSTIVVKLLLFPLVYQSNVAMAKMREIQPKMKEIQERYKADRQRMQQEQIRLFQTEKVNPVAGCVPILLQIPVFFALYSVLTVTIEMRHAPFVLWIRDLSAPDPTNIFNLFGLLPFDPSSWPIIGGFLALGVLPILYGVTMFALQALSPPPTDPTQALIFKLLPIVFTFLFASFAAGMVLYWTWSNILSIIQQYVIMRRMKVSTEFDKWLAKRFPKKDQPPIVAE